MKFFWATLLLFALLCFSQFSSPCPAQNVGVNGQPAAPNYVLSLGGTNGFLELPSGAFNDLEEVTIEGWVKWMDDRDFRRFFDFGKERYSIHVTRLEASPHIVFLIPPPGGGGSYSDTGLVARDLFRTNQWFHFAAVIARDRAQFYVNGALAASAPNRTPFNRLQRGERNLLGRDNWKDNMFPNLIDTEAFMDEFRVWRGARTGDQIRENLFRRLTGKEPDLVCLLNFDDQTPADKSPRANATKLVGAALLSVSVLNTLRAQALPGVDFRGPAQVLAALNRAYRMENHNQLYFTIWYGVYRLKARELVYASGGHPPALLFGGTGPQKQSPIALKTASPAIGCLEEAAFLEAIQSVESGARLLVLSDGVFEILRPNNQTDTWNDFVAGFTSPDIAALRPAERLRHVQQLRGGELLEDDFSLVEVRFP